MQATTRHAARVDRPRRAWRIRSSLGTCGKTPMGADWVKFKVQPGADLQELRELATFVSEQYPHGRWIVKPSGFAEDETTRDRWQQAVKRLESQLLFPKGCLDYWSHTA